MPTSQRYANGFNLKISTSSCYFPFKAILQLSLSLVVLPFLLHVTVILGLIYHHASKNSHVNLYT